MLDPRPGVYSYDSRKITSTTTRIPSNRRIFIEQGYSLRDDCRIVISFEPMPNAAYVSSFSLDKTRRLCTMELSRVDADGKRVPEPTAQREENSPLCLS